VLKAFTSTPAECSTSARRNSLCSSVQTLHAYYCWCYHCTHTSIANHYCMMECMVKTIIRTSILKPLPLLISTSDVGTHTQGAAHLSCTCSSKFICRVYSSRYENSSEQCKPAQQAVVLKPTAEQQCSTKGSINTSLSPADTQ
jgi:hypothetical protein